MSDIKIKNFINGEWQEEAGGKRVPLYNPSTGEQIGEVPMSGADACEAAIATAWEAYQTWREVPVAKRVAYIFKLREAMIRNHEKLAQGIAWDQAKHISEARGEVQRVIEILESAAATPSTIQGEHLGLHLHQYLGQGGTPAPGRVRRGGSLQLPGPGLRLVHSLRHCRGQYLHLQTLHPVALFHAAHLRDLHGNRAARGRGQRGARQPRRSRFLV